MKYFLYYRKFIFLAPVLALFLVASLNYSGMCVSEGKWLSDKDFLYRMTQKRNGSKQTPFLWDDAVAEVNAAPHCCTIQKHSGLMKSFLEKIVGIQGALVIARYKLNKFGILQLSNDDIPPYDLEYMQLSNCGNPGYKYGENISK